MAPVNFAGSAEVHARAIGDWLTSLSEACMPRRFSYGGKRPAYWWNPDIAELRSSCQGKRRRYQRKRKRRVANECEEELQEFRLARRALTIAIKKAKEKSWQDLRNTINNNPWGHPYRLVLKKLRRKLITTVHDSEKIAESLFPDRTQAPEFVRVDTSGDTFPAITAEEVRAAASQLLSGKAPGPDNIPGKVVRIMVGKHPEPFARVFNECLESAVYPTAWKTANLALNPKAGGSAGCPSAF